MKNLISLIAILITTLFVTAQQSSFIQWSFKTQGSILSHPIIDDGIIFFGSMDSVFYAVDVQTGKEVWSFKTQSSIQSEAIILKNKLYFKSGNDVFALNKRSGDIIWKVMSKEKRGVGKIDPWDYHSGAPAIYNSTIYFGLGNGELLGLDLEKGDIEKKMMSEDSASIKSGLFIDYPILYFGDWAGKIYAYNLEKGKRIWDYKCYEEKLYETFGQINTQLCVSGDLLFFGGRNPEMQVLDKNTGEKKWAYIEKEGGWISGDPLILNDTLFIGGSDNHEMFAFDANTGQKYWTYVFLNNNFSKPLPYDKYLLFTTGDAYNVYGKSPGRGYLYALNRSDGSIVNFTKVGGNIYSNLLEENNVLFMGSADGFLYAMDLEAFLKEKPNLKQKGYRSIEILSVHPPAFTDSVEVKYKANYETNIRIEIKDLNEDVVSGLLAVMTNKGTHSIKWDGKNNKGELVEDGYYFFEISSADYFKKILIQKKP